MEIETPEIQVKEEKEKLDIHVQQCYADKCMIIAPTNFSYKFGVSQLKQNTGAQLV